MAGLLGHISQDDHEWIETRFLCPNCNNYGFPSTYNFIEFDRKIGLCTTCANRLRFDGRHTVVKNEIRKKRKDE